MCPQTPQVQMSSNRRTIRPPEPPRSRRHGAPAGPWPWTDFNETKRRENGPATQKDPDNWKEYPKSLFPNWDLVRVSRSGIAAAVAIHKKCTLHCVDIEKKLPFKEEEGMVIDKSKEQQQKVWQTIQNLDRSQDVKVRTIFLDRPSGPVLQMIGTKYKIEPFFFSSSLNYIPSRYQEDNLGDEGDHITITLPFLRQHENGSSAVPPSGGSGLPAPIILQLPTDSFPSDSEVPSSVILQMELLAIHMVRKPHTSTIVSFHPEATREKAAEHLRSRIMDAGHSVYWADILEKTEDPTFTLLIYLWYALYAWDEALESLYMYVGELETDAKTSRDVQYANTLHTLHAHFLSYKPFLRDFAKSVKFVLETPNPSQKEFSPEKQKDEDERLKKECNNLLSEVERLEMTRNICAERLKNAMKLLFSSVNIEDSRAMKQISLLTMIFLPASFSAAVFGMNIQDLSADPDIKGTLGHYFATAVPLTILTIWFIVASQTGAPGSRQGARGWQRLAWPVASGRRILHHCRRAVDMAAAIIKRPTSDKTMKGIAQKSVRTTLPFWQNATSTNGGDQGEGG